MHTITAANLADASTLCPAADQAREIVPGCTTWGITYAGGQRGQMTEWPSGRGAIALGGDSAWGDWTADGLLHCDDGTVYDRSGVEVRGHCAGTVDVATVPVPPPSRPGAWLEKQHAISALRREQDALWDAMTPAERAVVDDAVGLATG